MDPNTMRMLGNERYESIVKDADTARLMGVSGKRRRRRSVNVTAAGDSAVARAVIQSLSAILRCQWQEAKEAVVWLSSNGTESTARLAVSAILARLIGTHGEADELVASLRLALPAAGSDSNTWAAATVAIALQNWVDGADSLPHGGAVAVSPASTDLVRDLCVRARSVGGEAMDLLCLSLALRARTAESRVLGAFLLGHLSDAIGNASFGNQPQALGGGVSPAARAAMGLSFLTLGQVDTGRRILLGAIDATDSMRMPLVEGLVDAEMVRLDHEIGDDSHALGWIERTNSFTERYNCPLPAEVVRAAS